MISCTRNESCPEDEWSMSESEGLDLGEDSITLREMIQKSSVRAILVFLGLGLLLFILVPGILIAGNLLFKFSEGFFIGFFTGVILVKIILVRAFSGINICPSSHYLECVQRKYRTSKGE